MESLPYISNPPKADCSKLQGASNIRAKERRYLDDLLAINSRRQAA
jgi:hypothetical protein